MEYSKDVLAISSEENGAAPRCCHHWVIDTPEGPLSKGYCRLCGESREFKNFVETAPWEDELVLKGTRRWERSSKRKSAAPVEPVGPVETDQAA